MTRDQRENGSTTEGSEQETGYRIIVRRASEVSESVKQNPFYDSEIFGRAKSPEEIYLPDSDEAISFAMAAHEIGHLVKEGEGMAATLDNFEATRAEELRAWEKGWPYLEQYVRRYYGGDSQFVERIHQSFERIRDLMMQVVDMGKQIYLEPGGLAGLRDEEIEKLTAERRQTLFQQRGKEMQEIARQIKTAKVGVKPDWNRFVEAVTQAVKDILRDSQQ